ncbi:MAG TPA: hypothetical protein PK777_04460 [Thermoguttaceae bacterium]|nr:hypothetical protein [Thermoguttaceae bacterium]
MGKHRKSSGLFETIVKSAFGIGTTVHRTTDWLGRPKTIVKHHDSGKTKEYTHGTDFFGDKTRVRVKNGSGHVTQQGHIKKNFWGNKYETLEHTDGSGRSSKRKFNVGIFVPKDKLTTYDAQGRETGYGEGKHGVFTGIYRSHYDGQCWTCNGTGTFQKTGKPCRKCGGTGVYRKP